MKQELQLLRKLMSNQGVDIYIVPTNDFHGSEYINEYFRTRKFISGFTGSAGTLIVTLKDAYLWTDGRYFLQAKVQLEGSGIQLMKSGEQGVPTIEDFLKSTLRQGETLAFDGKVASYRLGLIYEEIASNCNANICYDLDLINQIWETRPALQGNPIWALPETSYGTTFEEKIGQVRSAMFDMECDYHIITGLEENAWLYNLRGSDVDRTPVFFSFTIISPDTVTLYIFKDSIDSTLIPSDVNVKNYFDIFDDIKTLPITARLLADFDAVSFALIKSVPDICKIIDHISPVTSLKAIKNETEIAATKRAHIGDGVAMVNFIYWLKQNIGKIDISEISAADYLEEQRRRQEGFLDLSFDTIAGYMANGAIIHYTATEESNTSLEPRGYILVDSGGQYLQGTTDITRTIALGSLTDKMKKYYTAVLRGHIDLAMAIFSKGTTGADLDSLARQPLNAIGLDFNHGSGHGVGHILSVHEGPQNISKRPNKYDFKAGMITSDEPGVYIEGEFGIRIENEILCKTISRKDDLLGFEMLTLCPYEREAIEVSELTDSEKQYINKYHENVYNTLSPLLSDEVRNWLREETLPL